MALAPIDEQISLGSIQAFDTGAYLEKPEVAPFHQQAQSLSVWVGKGNRMEWRSSALGWQGVDPNSERVNTLRQQLVAKNGEHH